MNQVVIIGNLTKDPEVRETNTGKKVCKFTVAVNEHRMNPNSGEYEDIASYIPVVVWGKQADSCGLYLRKGSKAAVNGRIKTGSYTKQDGTKVYTTDVVANTVEFLGTDQPRIEKKEEPIPAEFGQYAQLTTDDVPF